MRGIINIGCSCYVSACMQVLAHCKPIQKILEGSTLFLTALVDTLSTLKQEEGPCVHPSALIQALQSAFKNQMDFSFRVQNDACELLQLILDRLLSEQLNTAHAYEYSIHMDHPLAQTAEKNWLLEHKDHLTNSALATYAGQHVTIVQCEHCKSKYYNAECFNMLFVDPKPGISLEDAIQAALAKETLTEWTCDTCHTKGEATRRTRLWIVPKVVFVCVRKMSYQTGFESIPERIKFHRYQLLHTQKPIHRLRAAICHFGSPMSGHYIALARHKNTWWQLDDETFQKLDDRTQASLLCNHATLFVYEQHGI